MSLKTRITKLFPGSKLISKGNRRIVKRVSGSSTLDDLHNFRGYLMKNGHLEKGGHLNFYRTDNGIELEWDGIE